MKKLTPLQEVQKLKESFEKDIEKLQDKLDKLETQEKDNTFFEMSYSDIEELIGIIKQGRVYEQRSIYPIYQRDESDLTLGLSMLIKLEELLNE